MFSFSDVAVSSIEHARCNLSRILKAVWRSEYAAIAVVRGEPGDGMNVDNLEWRELFGRALLDLHPDELIKRIEETRSAIRARLRELPHDTDHRSQRGSMYDALHALRFLRSRIPKNYTDDDTTAFATRPSGEHLGSEAASIAMAPTKRHGEAI